MADASKKSRSPNFSLNDCLLLVELMGEDSGSYGLSCHFYLRHRFTTAITASSKKQMWKGIERKFNCRAEMPRDGISLQKKWDNLVQTHRAMYADYVHSQQMTGGGPCSKEPSLLTDAVMAVVGKGSSNTRGIVGTELDSSMLCVSQSNTTNNGPVEMQTGSSCTDIDMSPSTAQSADEQTVLQGNNSTVQIVCCKCQCHKKIEDLKEEKLKLQIKLLKKQLAED